MSLSNSAVVLIRKSIFSSQRCENSFGEMLLWWHVRTHSLNNETPWHFNKLHTLQWLMTSTNTTELGDFHHLGYRISIIFFPCKKCQSNADWKFLTFNMLRISSCEWNLINFCNDDFSFLFNFTGFCTFAITFEHIHTSMTSHINVLNIECWIHKNNSKVSTSQLLLCYHCRVYAVTARRKENKCQTQ